MKAIKNVKLSTEAHDVIGEVVTVIPECGLQVFDVATYHDNGDVDVFTKGDGIGLLTIGSGYWIDTRATSNLVEEIKAIFNDRGIKVTK